MIIIDNNILSTFVKIGEINLLFKIFSTEDIGITPSVYQEFKHGLESGHLFLQEILTLVEKKKIKLVPLSEEEIIAKLDVPASMDEGECESVIVSQKRGLKLITNEKIVKNYCKKHNIKVIDLPGILRHLWKEQFLSKEKARALTDKIENQDKIVIKFKEEIFRE